jgi:hypothetical protein
MSDDVKAVKPGWDIEGMVGGIQRIFHAQEIAVIEHVDPFRDALQDGRVDELLERVKEVYDGAVNSAYGDSLSIVNAMCGGPVETIPSAVYNAVGLAYPFLTRQQRDKGLRGVLNVLDGINSRYIQISHTPFIHEPLLITDITQCRPQYWPGLDEGHLVLKDHLSFDSFASAHMDKNGLLDPRTVNSSFIVAYSLLRSDFCSFGEDFLRAVNKSFLERVLKGIVTLRFGPYRGGKPLEEEKVESGHKRLRELLPASLHDRLEPLRLEADWVDGSQPQFR